MQIRLEGTSPLAEVQKAEGIKLKKLVEGLEGGMRKNCFPQSDKSLEFIA